MNQYLRIVAEIRRQIEDGALRPGDRVPSTRRITQEWGVAMATATKVLATLKQEGLVQARAGVGTVVAPRVRTPKRVREPQPDLNQDRIVRAAVAIADTDGLSALSMRRVATELGVATMSLYRYVPGKDELVFFMIDHAIGDEQFPATPPDGWRARLEYSARQLWQLFHRHRWLAPALSVTRPQLLPNGLAYIEWVLAALEEFHLDPTTLLHIHVTLFNYVRGLATALEPEAEAERDTGLTNDEWMDTQEAAVRAFAGSGRFATFLRGAMASEIDLDLDSLFEFGLVRLLDGLAAFLENR